MARPTETTTSTRPDAGSFVLRGTLVALGVLGVLFAASLLSRQPNDLQSVARKIVNGESFAASTLAQLTAGAAIPDGCDVGQLRDLLVLEAQMTDTTLVGDDLEAGDAAVRHLADRARQLLTCSPREAIGWLMLYWTQTRLFGLGPLAFDYLHRSYASGPNEAWVAVRRSPMAIGIFSRLPAALQEAALREFRGLVSIRIFEGPATTLAAAAPDIRARLYAAVADLPLSIRINFAFVLRRMDLPTGALDLPQEPARPWRRD